MKWNLKFNKKNLLRLGKNLITCKYHQYMKY